MPKMIKSVTEVTIESHRKADLRYQYKLYPCVIFRHLITVALGVVGGSIGSSSGLWVIFVSSALTVLVKAARVWRRIMRQDVWKLEKEGRRSKRLCKSIIHHHHVIRVKTRLINLRP